MGRETKQSCRKRWKKIFASGVAQNKSGKKNKINYKFLSCSSKLSETTFLCPIAITVSEPYVVRLFHRSEKRSLLFSFMVEGTISRNFEIDLEVLFWSM